MAISSDMLIERARMKRQVSFWRLATIGALVVFSVILLETPNITSLTKPYIARIDIDGTITEDPDQQKLLRDIAEDDNARAVLLYLDTPGGTAVGGEELYKLIHKIREKKPVVALMRSVCASAGYMTAVATDRVYVMEGSLTGSIGVIFQTADVTPLADKVGIQPVIIKSGPLKGAPSPFEPLEPEARVVLQQLVNDFHQTFVRMVAESRKLPFETVAGLADGRIFSGNQAVELKLADQIGGEAEAREWLSKEKKIDEELDVMKREVPQKRKDFLERVIGFAGFTVPDAVSSLELDGLLAIWQPAVTN